MLLNNVFLPTRKALVLAVAVAVPLTLFGLLLRILEVVTNLPHYVALMAYCGTWILMFPNIFLEWILGKLAVQMPFYGSPFKSWLMFSLLQLVYYYILILLFRSIKQKRR